MLKGIDLKKPHIWVFVVLIAIYLALSLGTPIDPETLARYEISSAGVRLLNLTVVVPLSIIFIFALYGFIRFRNYANSVKDTKEGPHLNHIANGLTVLAYSLPISSIVGSIASYAKIRQPHLHSEIVIARNYLSLLLVMSSMILLAKGAVGLQSTLSRRKENPAPPYWILAPIALASLYTWLLVYQGNGSADGNIEFLPDWLVVISLAIPYVFTWYIGIIAATELQDYKNRVKGRIYRAAIGYLSVGIGIIVSISILTRFITTLSDQLSRLHLTPVLAIVYFLVALYAFGFGMVARGAKRLKQIEEV